MQQSPAIELGDWTPDRQDLGSPGLEVAQNVLPSEGVYGPFRKFETSDDSGPGFPLRGFISYQSGAVPFMGTETGYYRRVNGEWVLETSHNTDFWQFEQWGGEILALSENGLYYAPISGGPLVQISDAGTASYLRRVDNFIMLGGADGVPHRLRWSGFNDRTIWGTDTANQSDFQDLAQERGAITGITYSQFATVFQERAITRITYEGPPVVFSFDEYETAKGCIAPNSLVTQGYLTYFISQDGPNVWDGQAARPIGNGRYRKWFTSNFASDSKISIRAAIDWANNAVVWLWRDAGYTKGLVYSWEEDRATHLKFSGGMTEIMQAPTHIDGLDNEMAWGDGNMELAALDLEGRFGAFSGAALSATIQTGDFQVEPQRKSMVGEVWPTANAANITARVGSKANSAADERSWGESYGKERNGMVPARATGRIHAVELTIPEGEDWSHSSGFQVGFRSEGRS